MIEVQQIADFLNTELNNIGKSHGYNFDIKAEVGKRTNDNAIYGIVTTTKADARVDENVDYVFTVELSVPSAQSNENVINVEKIIGEFKNKFHMKNRAFGGGQGTLLISLATPKDYQIKYVVGDDVPLVFTITTEYIRNAVGSGDKHWLLNGMEIPFINESVSVQKEGRTNTIHGESYTKTLLTRQTRYYKFGFDYDNSELCIMLKKDLLDGKYDKVYTLEYYDGVSFTQEQPFTTSVSIFANGQSSSTKPNVSEFDITFTDVDNEEEAQYFMALIDNPFDSTTENTRYFTNEEEQRVYYQAKIDNDIRVGGVGCQFVKIKAPNLSSVVITNQVYEIPLHEEQPIYDVFSVANKNYAIIKVVKGKDEQWFYYYVSNQNIGGQNQVMFDLKLDSIQTYYFNPELQFGECLIEKGHLNRWIDNGDGTVSFDGTVDSKLFEREDIQNVAKRLTKRSILSLYSGMGNTEIENWLKDNVRGWIYIYFDKLTGGTVIGKDSSTQNYKSTSAGWYEVTNNGEDGSIPTNIRCISFPVYHKRTNIIKFQSAVDKDNLSKYVFWGGSSSTGDLTDNSAVIRGIGDLNIGYDKIYAIKFSIKPPFTKIPNDIEYNITKDGNYETLTIYCEEIDETLYTDLLPTAGDIDAPNIFRSNTKLGLYGLYGYVSITNSRDENFCNYEISKQLTFNKDEIIDKKKNTKFNPKLLSSDYCSLSISDTTEDGFEYDIQKLNMKNIEIQYTEPLIPDISKIYIRISNANGVYVPETKSNLTGFINSNDNSILLATTAYQSMLAQNKNFFLQNSINRSFDLFRGIMSNGLSTAGSIKQGPVLNPVNPMGIANNIVGGINNIANYAQSKINENLTIDNLKSAPSKIVGAKGNVIFENMYSKSGVIVEEYDILPNEKEIINDYMCKYGFTVNRFGNPKEYDNIRHYYNYVKAQIDSISGVAISNAARDDLRQRFANGVRFWKQDSIDYSKENYEEWLTKASTVNKATISWGQTIGEYIVAEYNGQEHTEEFITNSNDMVTFRCVTNRSISIENIQSDGEVEVTKPNRYTAVLTYKNATYVTMNIRVYQVT